jgi:hypothetical protein
MTDDRKILDLDELFGQAKAVRVKWQGQEYELFKMEAISPQDAVRFQKLQVSASKLQMKEGMGDADAKQVEKLIDDILKLLCKELPLHEIKFMVKMRILTYYIEETQGKKALETALNQVTGGKFSAS